jgi:hypothetical protein
MSRTLDKAGLENLGAWFKDKPKAASPANGNGSYHSAKLRDLMEKIDFPDVSPAVQSLLTLLAIEHVCNRSRIEEEFKKSAIYRETHWGPSGENKWERLRESELDLAIQHATENIRKRLTKDKPEEAPHTPLVISTAGQLLKKSYKKREPLMVTQANGFTVFALASINQWHAFRGVGKTAAMLGLTGAVANGGEFLQWKATRKFRVLYVEGELPGEEMQERIRSLVGENENFAVITPEDQPDSRIPSIVTAEGRRLIEEALVAHKAEVLVLDSISTLANIATNDESEWLVLCDWFRFLRNHYGLALFFLMHDGKTGLQRGHSKSEDLPDKSVQLFWENGYKGQDGLKFALTFDKARQPVKEAHSLSVELIEKDGKLEWISAVRDSSSDSQKALAFTMFDAGQSIAKVRETLKANQNLVAEWKKEWKQSKKGPLEIETQQVIEDGVPRY